MKVVIVIMKTFLAKNGKKMGEQGLRLLIVKLLAYSNVSDNKVVYLL